ncbi:MAG: rod-binding protein [Planctomycetota bacterium]
MESSAVSWASLATLQGPLPSQDPARVAEGFEAIFLSTLLEPMVAGEGFFGSGAEARVFSGLFRQQLADQLAKVRPLGIADGIEKVLRQQASPQAVSEAYRKGSE